MRWPSRHSLAQGATLLLLAGCATIFARQLSSLSQTVQTRPSAEQIQGLQQQLQRIDHELEGMQRFKGVLKTDFQQTQQSLSQRLDVLETAARTVDSLTASLTAVNARVQATEGTLLMLKASVEKCPATCPAAPVAEGPPTKTKARVTKPTAGKPSAPPFVLLGLESRAGEAFLAVLPKGQQRLGDVHLLRPGMQLQGWRLSALDARRAHWIKPDGIATSVSIP
ncbi:hypothetical protein [Pseudomonas vanderleydeniana]|uniref:Uncharacterized protein n=1 Tax=Pseudomonas vanderleydeniana TaxID=2745495 RepID=A0A9E6PQU4_9PSED|nr:hypothetical protein [Pseudomonas vanderleydeniana]QXI31209.1 hypothetical protein HU752_015305 [Pseudomonas vanderleydeniana]